MSKNNLHSKNVHKLGYDFDKLINTYLTLSKFVFTNSYGTKTIDFANPKAVKALNTALLKTYYNISFWNFSDENLCPPIPGRADYIHHLNDLISTTNNSEYKTILDIGTGATCIYPLLGNAIYNWKFVGTDIDDNSLNNAQEIINNNHLNSFIKLRKQPNNANILTGIITENDVFTATMCNPPFYGSQYEAIEANLRKLKGLGIDKTVRNFSGNQNELWYKGGEKAFLHNYLYQSTFFKNQCCWFTSLVSKKENVKSMYESLNKLKATKIKTIEMNQGNKITRIIAWSFLTDDELKNWNK